MLWVFASIAIAIGITLLILLAVFGALKQQVRAEAARLRDVELDSGLVKMTTRFDNFRYGKLYRGGGLRINYADAVLTKSHLHLLERPQYYGVFTRADLACFTVAVQDGALQLRSERPPGASGTIDYRIPVPDPERWVKTLVAAGAKRA